MTNSALKFKADWKHWAVSEQLVRLVIFLLRWYSLEFWRDLGTPIFEKDLDNPNLLKNMESNSIWCFPFPANPCPLNLGGDISPKMSKNTVKQGVSDTPPLKFRGESAPPKFRGYGLTGSVSSLSEYTPVEIIAKLIPSTFFV